jgi:hypothetical protein
VELVVPKNWQTEEINSLLDRKAEWIREKQTFFQQREHGRLVLASNEVLLFGEPFRIEVDEGLEKAIEIDIEDRRLRVADACSSETHIGAWQQEFAKTFLSNRTRQLSEKHGLKFGRLFLRSQRTKWGNCSAKRNISLNWRLISAPERGIDYVILQELLHTKTMNHSQSFWVHLNAFCPWVKEAVAWLSVNQPEPDMKQQ